jgi:hypothetical protein
MQAIGISDAAPGLDTSNCSVGMVPSEGYPRTRDEALCTSRKHRGHARRLARYEARAYWRLPIFNTLFPEYESDEPLTNERKPEDEEG